jgi:thymidylate synthase
VSVADDKYRELILDIRDNGEWDTGGKIGTKYVSDGAPAYTKSVFGRQVTFEPGDLTLLTSKQVAYKTAIKEILQFWVQQETTAKAFRENGVKIWDEWFKVIDGEEGIGRSYGYQLRKSKQVERILKQIENSPMSRRMLFSYWNEEDLSYKALMECVWAGQFNVRNNRLDMLLNQRSVDIALGYGFNSIQYRIIQHMIAQVTGLEVGYFIHQMGNVHYYDRHEEKLLEQIMTPTYRQPTLKINPEINNFFDFTIDDFQVENYNHNGKIEFDLAEHV